MTTNTSNYNLVKQGENEFYDVEVVNENLDKIDIAIKQTKDIAERKANTSHTHTISDVSNLQTTLNNKANNNDLTTLETTVTQHLAQIGDLTNLDTTNKESIVGAMNELRLGTVIEYGTNINGMYIKFSSGLLINFHTIITTSFDGWQTFDWVLPYSYTDVNYIGFVTLRNSQLSTDEVFLRINFETQYLAKVSVQISTSSIGTPFGINVMTLGFTV